MTTETFKLLIRVGFLLLIAAVAVAGYLVVSGCAAGPVGPTPGPAPVTPPLVDASFHVEGKWDFIVRVVGIVIPLPNIPVSGNGKATITIQSRPPWATVDAELNTTIDATPAATKARSNGSLLIRRAGKPAGFAPEGAPVGPPPPPQELPAPPTEPNK